MIADTVDAFAALIDGALPDPWSVNTGTVDAAAPPVVWVTANGAVPDTARVPSWSVAVRAQVIPDAALAGQAGRAAWDAAELIALALDDQTALTVLTWSADEATDQVGGASQRVVTFLATFLVPTC